MTLIEVLMVLAAVMMLTAIFFSMRPRSSDCGNTRLQCVNNLRQIGLATRVWAADNGDTYPMFVPQTNGGSKEFSAGPNAWRHMQVMSNELSTPKILICPGESDSQRFLATNFFNLNNSNFSFFVGMVSNNLNPRLIFSGDHNLTNGAASKNAMLDLTARQPIGWSTNVHNQAGNIGLADGSVQRFDSTGVQRAVARSGIATNVIQMPLLGP